MTSRIAWTLVGLAALLVSACTSLVSQYDKVDGTSDTDTGTAADLDTDTDADSDTDSDGDTDTDSDGDTDTDSDGDTDTDSDGDTDTISDSDSSTDELFCSGSGTWLDAETNLCWESPPASAVDVYATVAAHCGTLGVGWRVPTISELRSIGDGCGRVGWDLSAGVCDDTDSCCAVSDACDDESCWSTTLCDGCLPIYDGPGPWGCYLKAGLLGTCTDGFFSATVDATDTDRVWTVHFADGTVVDRNATTTSYQVRCVLTQEEPDSDSDTATTGDGGAATEPCTPISTVSCGESLSGGTMDAGVDEIDSYSCAPFAHDSREVAYSFASPLQAVVDVTLGGLTADLSLIVIPDEADAGCDPDACVTGSFTPLLADEAVSFVTPPDESYQIVVDSWGDLTGPFDLTVECEQCVPEGGSHVIYPGSPDCCPPLAGISCDSPDTDGVCDYGCVGASICASCGDSVCGPGENKCNCPADCPT